MEKLRNATPKTRRAGKKKETRIAETEPPQKRLRLIMNEQLMINLGNLIKRARESENENPNKRQRIRYEEDQMEDRRFI